MTEKRVSTDVVPPNGFSRRRFLEAVALLTAASPLVAVSGTPARAAPKQGGTARFALNDGAQTDSFDPASWLTSFAQAAFGGTLCNALAEIAVDGSVAPDLAESWTPSADLKTWTVKLKPGLLFHDGRKVSPNDVVASFRHHMGENSTSGAKALVESIADMKVAGADTVVFTLKGGNADFPYLLSDHHLAVMPAKADGGLDWEKGVATGPFKVVDFQPGIVLKLVRNPTYHKPGLPYFDAVEFINIIDVAARTNALVTGEIDYMVDADIKTLSLLEQNPKVEISKVAGVRHFSFDMNVKVAPFDDPAVRLALKHAIDRKDILAKAFLGNAKVADDNPVAPQIRFAATPQPTHDYDPAKAKAILAKAGKSNLTVDLSVADTAFPGAVDAALLFKEHAAKAGITVNVIREADDGYWDNIWQKKPFVGTDWLGKATIDALFTTCYAGDGPWNDTGYADPKFDALLVEARGMTDPAERQKRYAEMQQMLHDDGGPIVIAYAWFIDAISKKIAHGPIGNMLQCDNFRMAERWWLA